jgi:hypothetical protein
MVLGLLEDGSEVHRMGDDCVRGNGERIRVELGQEAGRSGSALEQSAGGGWKRTCIIVLDILLRDRLEEPVGFRLDRTQPGEEDRKVRAERLALPLSREHEKDAWYVQSTSAPGRLSPSSRTIHRSLSSPERAGRSQDA